MAFRIPLDIINRALQGLGKNAIASVNTASNEANAVTDAYDTLRLAELQRNLWKFATRRVILRPVGIDTVLWAPAAWSSGASYNIGGVVSHTPTEGPYANQESYWQLAVYSADPTDPPDIDPRWRHFTGPLAIDLYDPDIVYQTGEIVLVPAPFELGTTYSANDVVAYENGDTWEWYVSLEDGNLGNTPPDTEDSWVLWVGNGRSRGLYGQTETKSPIPLTYPDGYTVHLSRYNNNADNPNSQTSNWTALSATVTQLLVPWPIGTGPVSDAQTANCFYLPNGFLKRAPNHPHGNQPGYLGAASGVPPDDWTPEGPLLVTGDVGPITLRFVADITDVAAMDAMFCEGFAARMAVELAMAVVEDPTAPTVRAAAMQSYSRVMREARTANAIEIGPFSPVENKYVTVRH